MREFSKEQEDYALMVLHMRFVLQQHQEQEHEDQRDAGQRPAHPGRLGGVRRCLLGGGHAQVPERLRCQTCKALMTNNSKKEKPSITTATAVAPA